MADEYAPEGWEKVAGELYEALRVFKATEVDDWWHGPVRLAMNAYWNARDDLNDGVDDASS